MLPIKEHLKTLERIKNPAEERLGYLRLDKNENIAPLPEEFIKKLQQCVTSDFVSAYPETAPLYEQLAEYLGCKPDNLYLTSGSDGAIKSVFEVFVQPSDDVLLLGPSYAMFYVYAGIFQARLTEVCYDQNLEISAQEIISAIRKLQPKLVCIANPNSPTGTIIKPEVLQEIIQEATDAGSVVLIDEAYYLFYPESCVKLINRFPNLVVTRTFSKAFGLASARLGYAVGSEEMISCLHKTRPMYEVNAFAVKFAEMILDDPGLVDQFVQPLKEGKNFLEQALMDRDINFFKSYANFLLINVGSQECSAFIVDYLKKQKILIKGNFSFPAMRNCIRINVGTIKQMGMFLAALDEALKAFEGRCVSK